MGSEIEFIVASPPGELGHCKLNEFGWHGGLALSEEGEQYYLEAVKIRDTSGLQAAADYLTGIGWRVTWAWVGVHGD